MKSNYVLSEYYSRYMKDIRMISESSIKHYLGAMNTISKILLEKNKINDSIYEITSIDELCYIREYLFQEPLFIKKDEKGQLS